MTTRMWLTIAPPTSKGVFLKTLMPALIALVMGVFQSDAFGREMVFSTLSDRLVHSTWTPGLILDYSSDDIDSVIASIDLLERKRTSKRDVSDAITLIKAMMLRWTGSPDSARQMRRELQLLIDRVEGEAQVWVRLLIFGFEVLAIEDTSERIEYLERGLRQPRLSSIAASLLLAERTDEALKILRAAKSDRHAARHVGSAIDCLIYSLMIDDVPEPLRSKNIEEQMKLVLTEEYLGSTIGQRREKSECLVRELARLPPGDSEEFLRKIWNQESYYAGLKVLNAERISIFNLGLQAQSLLAAYGLASPDDPEWIMVEY